MHVGINAEAILVGAKLRLAGWWGTGGRLNPPYKLRCWINEQVEG